MSIWSTISDLEDNPPYAYQGSHVLPSAEDLRDPGYLVQLAEIPSHITRDGRDDRPEDGAPWPWLRLSMLVDDVVLDRSQVAEVYAVLGAWLEQTKPPAPSVRHVGGQANAEDCLACAGTSPPYPFLCPGEAS